jgi:microcystin-dependent protein
LTLTQSQNAIKAALIIYFKNKKFKMDNAGLILLYAGQNIPQGWLPCDGRLLQVNGYRLLFSILRNNYGGDRHDTFGLPKRDNVNNLRYLIHPDGRFVDMSLSYTFDPNDEERIIGFVLPFAGGNVPDGWVLCDGRHLKMSENATLQAVLGDRFNTANTPAHHFSLPKTDEPHIVCISGRYPE